MDVKDFNKGIIEEFRGNAGLVGGQFQGINLLLLHSVGAKSGEARVNPLVYFNDEDDMLIIASYEGAPVNPPWYHNLVANPETKIEVGAAEISVTAEVVGEPERSELYDKIAVGAPTFAEYQKKTSRVIPLIRLTKTQ